MVETRKGVLRGVGVLAAVLLAAGVISPAFSAAPLTKGKVKKIAKKQAIKQINALVPGIAIEETELVRFSGTANVGDAEKDLATIGPSSFTMSLLCEDSGGGIPRTRVQIRTSEDNSVLGKEFMPNPDFDTADQNEDVVDATALNATDPETFEEGEFFAFAPSGLGVGGEVDPAANSGGADCYVRGWVIQTAPA